MSLKHFIKKIWQKDSLLEKVLQWMLKNLCCQNLSMVSMWNPGFCPTSVLGIYCTKQRVAPGVFHRPFACVPECGAAFTSKLEGMFKDMELSKDIMGHFKQASSVFSSKIAL